MRRGLVLLATLVGVFCTSAAAVAFFADTKETNETVLSGPPISAATVLRLLSDATDTSNLGYAKKNHNNDPAATGGDTAPLVINLGRRQNAVGQAWKGGASWFYRTFTVLMPSNAPVGSATLSLEQSVPTPPLNSGASSFAAMQFASITTGALQEGSAGFAGTDLSPPVTITPNQKLQVNLQMGTTSLTSATNDQSVRLTLTVVATLPDGSEFRYPISVAYCDHQNANQCGGV